MLYPINVVKLRDFVLVSVVAKDLDQYRLRMTEKDSTPGSHISDGQSTLYTAQVAVACILLRVAALASALLRPHTANPKTLQDPLCLAHEMRMMHYVDILEVNNWRERLSVLLSSEMQTYSFS